MLDNFKECTAWRLCFIHFSERVARASTFHAVCSNGAQSMSEAENALSACGCMWLHVGTGVA